MEIRYTAALDDFITANRVTLLHRGGLVRLKYLIYVQYAYVIGPLLAVAGFWALLVTARHSLGGGDGSAGFVISLALMGGGIGWLFNPMWARHKLERIFNRRKEPHDYTLVADDAGIAAARGDGAAESRIKWSMLEKSTETDSCFVLLLVGGQGIPVPKRTMTPEQQEELRDLLARHVPGSGPIRMSRAVS
ncbi:MAG TPA: YcxB family protein [Acidobacteriaceae bacterium]